MSDQPTAAAGRRDAESTTGDGRPPSAEQAAAWEGWRLDDVTGAKTGSIESVYRDAESGDGVWLGVRMGRFGHRSVLPLGHCVGLAGRVWAPYERNAIRNAPRVDPGKPLTREDELALLEAFGLPTDSGRGAEVSVRPRGEPTARPG